MPIKTKIDKTIDTLGSISIQDFVELSNFDEEGFYNLNEESKISNKGHFITSPEISSLFGYSLCNQFLRVFRNSKKVHLLELGPGNGTLIKDIQRFLTNQKIEISQISVLERSSYFKKKMVNEMSSNIKFLNSLLDLSVNDDETLFVYCNEFFDAISAKQYIFKDQEFYEIKVAKNNDKYRLIYEGSLISNFLKNYYSKYSFENGDILEHSNLLVNYLEDLRSILKNNFFVTATDYGYKKLPKKSTLRLISNHQHVRLFDKFESVDYSFGVNFELISNTFKEFKPILLSQSDLIKFFLPQDFKDKGDKKIIRAIDLISGKKFSNLGTSFINISFFSK